MESLSESVYECTLPVEAHMICDLLARAGISARVDGEFLAGAGGELPLGSAIKVRVDPSRAAEAREVIDEWQRQQPPPDPVPASSSAPARRSPWITPLWFIGGIMIGGLLMLAALRVPATRDSADWDGDGRVDETYYYSGQVLDRTEYDRNADRQVDLRWIYDYQGIPKRMESDDNFDGHFEWQSEIKRGSVVRSEMDEDDDGRPELVQRYRHGVLISTDIYDGDKLVVRETYGNSRLVSREYDQDGDGAFERRVEFDAIGDPVP